MPIFLTQLTLVKGCRVVPQENYIERTVTTMLFKKKGKEEKGISDKADEKPTFSNVSSNQSANSQQPSDNARMHPQGAKVPAQSVDPPQPFQSRKGLPEG